MAEEIVNSVTRLRIQEEEQVVVCLSDDDIEISSITQKVDRILVGRLINGKIANMRGLHNSLIQI